MYDPALVECFLLRQGQAVELYGTTLHFAPARVAHDGFRAIVVLPKGTNEPLELPANPREGEEQLLWMRNKWLLCHPASIPASKGAWQASKETIFLCS
jgi:hypothetical protein